MARAPRHDPSLSWAGEMVALLGLLREAVDSGNVEVLRHQLALVLLAWGRRPLPYRASKR